jgi:hypothetical protein
MSDAMLDARQEGNSYRRIEVITGQRRRRRWTAQEKVRIVAESFEEGANISEVARRNGVVRGLLTVWRHKLAVAAGINAPGFVPVRIASEGGPAMACEPGRTCQFWAHAMDDRPWGGPSPPAVAYVFADSRGTEEIAGQLTGFSGMDGYAAYKALARGHGARRSDSFERCPEIVQS